MKGNKPDRDLIREYLLGRLDDRNDLENDTSESVLFDDEVAGLAESVEDEIIEDYLEGTLGPADRIAVDNYFLRPAERRDKLRFSRLVRNHFQTQPESTADQLAQASSAAKTDVHADHDGAKMFTARPSTLVFYAPLAALILVSILGLTYLSGLRSKQAFLERELAQERSRASGLAQEASLLQPPMVGLALVTDLYRSPHSQIPHLETKPTTQRVVVEIALPNADAGPYDVSLQSKGNASIWKTRLLPIVSASGDARLVFDVPARLVESGQYSFLVTSFPPAGKTQSQYDFDARTTP